MRRYGAVEETEWKAEALGRSEWGRGCGSGCQGRPGGAGCGGSVRSGPLLPGSACRALPFAGRSCRVLLGEEGLCDHFAL